MIHTDAVIYFYSGTGNSFRVAEWMAETIRQAGNTVRIIPFNHAHPAGEISQNTILGITTPTHGFTTPWSLIKFALQFPKGTGQRLVIAATRAGVRMFHFTIPGMMGTAAYLLALIFSIKGYRVVGVRGLDMPSNWLALHSGLKPQDVEIISNETEIITKQWMQEILAGKTSLHGWLELILGIILFPGSLAYLLMGRLFLSKLFFTNENCNGCGQCARFCPVQAIQIKNGRPYWTFSCESCMRCMGYCPTRAIEASHPLAVLVFWIFFLPATTWGLDQIIQSVSRMTVMDRTWLTVPVTYGFNILIIAVLYEVFQWFARNRILNKLFSMTTLTHYYRRYHQPAVNLERLNKISNFSVSMDEGMSKGDENEI
jgi:ferredoxin